MKKHQQLGMNAGTASHRLVRDLLFKFVTAVGEKCFRCGGELTRETFSIEHKTPWLDSNDPVGLFFDLGNIAFSHRSCNSIAARRPIKQWTTDEERKAIQTRHSYNEWHRRTPEERRARRRRNYEKNGC